MEVNDNPRGEPIIYPGAHGAGCAKQAGADNAGMCGNAKQELREPAMSLVKSRLPRQLVEVRQTASLLLTGRGALKSGVAAFIAALCTAVPAQARTPQDMLKQYSCYTCHSNRETKTGPSFVDVAAKYRGNPDAADHVAATMRKGRHGYGPWHMPPHPEISRADAMTMARYILSLER